MPIVKEQGSFRLAVNNPHLHGYFNFTEPVLETVGKSLLHSCRSELTRQGISLPLDRQSYGRRLLEFTIEAKTTIFYFTAPGRSQSLYFLLLISRDLCFY